MPPTYVLVTVDYPDSWDSTINQNIPHEKQQQQQQQQQHTKTKGA